MNALANHGFLPRSGIVTFLDLIVAQKEGYNIDYDLGTALAAIAVALDGDLLTTKVSNTGERRPKGGHSLTGEVALLGGAGRPHNVAGRSAEPDIPRACECSKARQCGRAPTKTCIANLPDRV